MADDRAMWLGDAVAFDAADNAWTERGESWSQASNEPIPKIRHPIGFQVGPRKPRVRIKAWTAPVIPNG